MNKVICVYSSSSNAIDTVYFEAAEALGREIAIRKDTFLFGGGLTGLMGACAKSVHRHGGKVIGVIPKALNVKGIVYDTCDELIVTEGMRERKGMMDSRSDVFIALPGGYGTLEEILEIITLKQLRYHDKPIVMLNIQGFYDKLLEQFEHIIGEKFAKKECKEIYYVAKDVEEALSYIDAYSVRPFKEQWLTDVEAKREC
ncbi:MAG: TIGR00730 family Rossman fold protein [Clostridia bacterium]|nr:TIGR00730 family Rossman fold protein [Clostridia bacterium]